MYGQTASFTDKVLLVSDVAIILGVILDSASAPIANRWEKGRVLGKITGSKKFKDYDDSKSDGSEVALCILEKETDFQIDATGSPVDTESAAIFMGAVIEADCVGLDANGKTDLANHILFF